MTFTADLSRHYMSRWVTAQVKQQVVSLLGRRQQLRWPGGWSAEWEPTGRWLVWVGGWSSRAGVGRGRRTRKTPVYEARKSDPGIDDDGGRKGKVRGRLLLYHRKYDEANQSVIECWGVGHWRTASAKVPEKKRAHVSGVAWRRAAWLAGAEELSGSIQVRCGADCDNFDLKMDLNSSSVTAGDVYFQIV